MLMISEDRFTRRCRDCWHTQTYSLPALKKRVIYLDQLALSEMMKALNPQTKAHQKGRTDPFWIALFEKLDALTKSQLVVCPDSSAHGEESVLSPFNKALRRMYELFSHGVSFHDPWTIERFQIHKHMTAWLAGTSGQLKFEIQSAIRGRDLHGWKDRIIVSAEIPWEQDWIDQLRANRDKQADDIAQVFARWQSEKHRGFDDWYEEEVYAYGSNHLRIYSAYYQRLNEMFSGKREPAVNDMHPPHSVLLINDILRVLRQSGLTEEAIPPKMMEYFSSPSMKDVPFQKISSLMWAAIARQAAHGGRLKLPSRGMGKDITTISTLLPYCDAMFIDKECRNLLSEEPLQSRINYGAKLFSLSNRQEFLDYLDDIKHNASAEHFDLVKGLYGDDFDKPFTTLYTIDDDK